MAKDKTIKSYIKKGVKKFYFKCYLGVDRLTGKPKYTTRRNFDNATEARKALVQVKYEFINNNYKTSGKETYIDMYNLWIAQYEKDVEESTFVKTKAIFRNHILPAIGEFLICNLNSLECQKHVNEWAVKLKGAKKVKAYASMVLDFAMKHGYITSNPFSVVSVPKKRKKLDLTEEQNQNFYSKEQLLTFLRCLKAEGNSKIYTFFHLLAFTGMRKGEVFALKWKDIDFEKKTIIINKALSKGENNQLYVKSTKTGTSRIIYIDSASLTILEAWRKTQFEDYQPLGFNTLNQDQLIFSNLKNQYIQPSITSKWLNNILTKYQLPNITTHGFRHTHCTLLSEAHIPPKGIQQRLGHADIQTTFNVYTHVSEQTQKGIAQILSEYMAS